MATISSSIADTPTVLTETSINSSLDGQAQTIRYLAPPSVTGDAPLLVFLHTWSSDVHSNYPEWVKEATGRGWIFVQPDFRGPNGRPEACGSPLAQQDVLDAVDWACSQFSVDRSRIYLAGASGGGHMSLLLAGKHPERFSAVSAYVGITDLADWYRFHAIKGSPDRYAEMTASACGGVPGASEAVDNQYRARSPIHWLNGSNSLPIDIAAGVHDGKKGSVPIRHSINAFNVLAQGRGDVLISEAELSQLDKNNRLDHPLPSDVAADASFGRDILLRRTTGPSRITIFEGGHEGLPVASCTWLSQQRRPTTPASTPSQRTVPAAQSSTR
jgi:poly(3-hydroxybutyrate) depolymerase